MIERMADLFPVDQSWSVYKLWPIRPWYIYIRYVEQGSYEMLSCTLLTRMIGTLLREGTRSLPIQVYDSK